MIFLNSINNFIFIHYLPLLFFFFFPPSIHIFLLINHMPNEFIFHILFRMLLFPPSHILLKSFKGNWDKINAFLFNGYAIKSC